MQVKKSQSTVPTGRFLDFRFNLLSFQARASFAFSRESNQVGKRLIKENDMTNFTLIFAAALALNVGITLISSDWWKKRQLQSGGGPSGHLATEDPEAKKRWQELLRKYLIVYLLAAMADWLQGPYVYALYSEYGFKQHDIAELFVAGFGSSMVFGSFVGGMADWGGRRAFVILFAVIYGFSCITKRKF
jgi:predicted MFS family arabinose efflux permease